MHRARNCPNEDTVLNSWKFINTRENTKISKIAWKYSLSQSQAQGQRSVKDVNLKMDEFNKEMGEEDRELTAKDFMPNDEEMRREKMGNLGAFATRAEIFHQMLMEDFRFMEAARMQSGEYEGATLSTDDLRRKVKILKIFWPLQNFTSKCWHLLTL